MPRRAPSQELLNPEKKSAGGPSTEVKVTNLFFLSASRGAVQSFHGSQLAVPNYKLPLACLSFSLSCFSSLSSSSNDANRMPVDEARRVAGLLLAGGFMGLPLLWLVNALYFRRHLRADGDATVRRLVLFSLLAGLGEGLAVLVWYLVYRANWSRWGVAGETLAIVMHWGA